MIVEVVLALVVFLIGYGLLINRIRGLPPGPPPLPILGNALMLGEPMDQLMLRLSKKYGPVYTLWMPSPTVVVTDHQIMHDTIVKQGDVFGDRVIPTKQMTMLIQGEYGIVNAASHMWKEQRRFAMHSLKDVGYSSARLQESTKLYAQQIVAHWKEEAAEGKMVDVTENIMSGVGNLIWELLYGRTLPFRDPLFMHVQETVHELFCSVVHPCVLFLEMFPNIGLLDPLFGYPIRKMVKSSQETMRILQSELDISEKSLNLDEEPRCFADSFLAEMKRREEKGEPVGNFTRVQLRAAAADMWTAGFETTVTTLRCAVYYLYMYPEVQRKMQAEIDKKIGAEPISLDDQKLLPYCVAAIHELQRVANIGELNFVRRTNQDTVVGGFKLAAGTAVLPEFPTVFIDPANFERPDYFCPERHLNEAGEFVKDPRVTPFSIGKRACLGEALARMELFIFITTFVQHCSFASPTLIPPVLEYYRGLTRAPVPFKVKVTARH